MSRESQERELVRKVIDEAEQELRENDLGEVADLLKDVRESAEDIITKRTYDRQPTGKGDKPVVKEEPEKKKK